MYFLFCWYYTVNFRLYPPSPTPVIVYLQTKKKTSGYKPLGYKLPSPSSMFWNEFDFYTVLKLKKASKFKKYLDQRCYVACFETALFFSLVPSQI